VSFRAVLLALLIPASLVAQTASKIGPAARRTGTFQDRRLLESSGVVASHRHPGLLWTMNDSGGEAALFLTDTTGAALGMFVVRGAVNVDWEALGRGPCRNRECLYIGDTGDNGRNRRFVTLYRVAEPEPAGPSGARTRGVSAMAEALQVRYPDRSHDVEAIYVEPEGNVMLITKGHTGGVLVFRVPASSWRARRPVTAERVDSLPIPATFMTGRVVTDAAISPDGHRVAVRTYRDIWFFTRDDAGRLVQDPSHPVCDIAGLEPQGEGIDWWDPETLVLTSERGLFPRGTITLVRCPAARG
jgi:hypothetical protein